MADKESPWKELVEQDRESAVAFFWGDIHEDLDWAREVESLEQEFRKIHPKSATGKRIVDKLLKAYRKADGEPRYLHLEVQGKPVRGFRRRVYVYNYRAEDYFDQPVASLVLLVDDVAKWFPRGYRAGIYGCQRTLQFRSGKILRYRGREPELESHANPVGLFVLAHLEGRRLKDDEPARAAVKLRLIRRLQQRGMTAHEMRHWYRYFDWLLPLSDVYDRQVWAEVGQSEEEKTMPFVTFAEKLGVEKGLEKGLEQGERIGLLKAIRLGLKLKFQEPGLALMPEIEKQQGLPTLEAIYNAIEPAASVDDVRKLLPAETNGQG